MGLIIKEIRMYHNKSVFIKEGKHNEKGKPWT